MLLRPVDDFELGSGFEAAEEDGGTLQGNTVWKFFYKPVYIIRMNIRVIGYLTDSKYL